ncbi:MAG: ethanolamine ammonia-lyase reactivating factor EutA [Emergencia timonensis]
MGQSISMDLPEGKDVICIDSIDAGKGDYVDIGRPVGIADAVPVVIKTIAFNY